jgi:hypothetical protein
MTTRAVVELLPPDLVIRFTTPPVAGRTRRRTRGLHLRFLDRVAVDGGAPGCGARVGRRRHDQVGVVVADAPLTKVVRAFTPGAVHQRLERPVGGHESASFQSTLVSTVDFVVSMTICRRRR